MRIYRKFLMAVTAIAAVGFVATQVSAATNITIVGAGKGAGAFRMAAGLAEAVNKTSKKVNVTNRESKGFVANTRLVANGRSEIGMTNGIFVDFIQRGKKPFHKGKPKNTIRGIGPVSTSWFQVATFRKSGIKTYHDLAGKRFNMGPRGSSTLFMTKFITDNIGVTGKIRKDYMGWAAAATNMIDGKLDAFGIPNPVPSPAILRASRSHPLRILSIPDDVRDKFVAMSSGYYKANKDASAYNGMKGKKFKTVAYTIFAVTNVKVSNDVVYEVASRVYDKANRDFLINVFKGWKIGLDFASKSGEFINQMKNFNMNLHPGAARYWKEKGYKVN
ncbi:MAG: TAXI family TRAP transporter solute-binding subunit [Nitrospinaceae bacterium]|nr:TAXI family TRAP transporter solute-binding subunit [Nitrospinaceae bacterium]